MNRFTGTIICMMTGMLAMAQQVYELDMPVKEKTIYSGHLKLGGSNPSGERIEVNSYYMSVGGKPVIPRMESSTIAVIRMPVGRRNSENEGRRSNGDSYVCILEYS